MSSITSQEVQLIRTDLSDEETSRTTLPPSLPHSPPYFIATKLIPATTMAVQQHSSK